MKNKNVLYIILLFITGYITYKLFTNKNTFSLSAQSVYCDPLAKPPQMCPGGIECPQCGKPACPCPDKPPPPPPPPAPPPPPPGTPHAQIISKKCTCIGGTANNNEKCSNIRPTNCLKCNDGYKMVNYEYYADLEKGPQLMSASICQKIIPYCSKAVVEESKGCSAKNKYTFNTYEGWGMYR